MIEQLHYITKDTPGRSHVELCEEACASGVRWVQLRRKNVAFGELLEDAKACREITKRHGAKLIINDNLDVAMQCGADGVHLGLQDMNTADARKLVPKGFIIGGTANTLEDIVAHASNGVDYVGVGPYRFTSTKEKLSPVLGIQGYHQIMSALRNKGIEVPVVAIGGILLQDVAELKETGIYGIAVSGLITDADDVRQLITNLMEELEDATVEDCR